MVKDRPIIEKSSLTDLLGPMFIINLPERKDRLRQFSRQLKAIGLSLDHPQIQVFEAVRPTEAGGFPSIGARGCFMSHLEILRTARDNNLEKILVCEDDLNFVSEFTRRLSGIASDIADEKWDMLYFGHEGINNSELFDGSCRLIPINSAHAIRTTHFFAMNRRTFAPLIEYLEAILSRPPGNTDGGPMHVDGAISRFRTDHPDVVTLAASPPMGYQRPSRTDIHDGKWFDKVKVLRDIAELARSFRNNFNITM